MVKLRVAVLAGGVFAATALAAAPASALGPLHHHTDSVSVAGKVTAVSIRNEVGDIRIVAGTTTRIVAKEAYNLAGPTLTHSLRDGVLTVSAPCPRQGPVDLGLNDCYVDFVLTVPSAVAVEAMDSVGDITVHGLRGNEKLRTDVGRIDAVLASAPRTVVARNSVGEVHLVLPSGSYALHLHTQIGSAHVRGITRDADAPHRVTATSDDGNIRIQGA